MTSDAFIEIEELLVLCPTRACGSSTRAARRTVPPASSPYRRRAIRARPHPGGDQLDYADQLADPATPHAARVAPPELFAQVLGERGIGDDAILVAYDDGDTPYAARFVWMCRYYGHDAVRVLAGGMPAWVNAGQSLTTDAPSYPPATFTPRVRPALRALREEVLAVAEGRSDAQLLETQRDKTYAQREHDIRNAVRLSGSLLLEDHRGGRVADRATIDRLVGDLGLDRSKRTIVSCGSGVSASVRIWRCSRTASPTSP